MEHNKNKIPRFSALAVWLFMLLIFLISLARADELSDVLERFDTMKSEEQALGGVLDRFEDNPVPGTGEDLDSSVPSPLHISGSVGVAGAFNLSSFHRPPNTRDRQGLAKLRGELDLTFDLNLGGSWRARVAGQSFYDAAYSLRDRDNYTGSTLDEYEKEAELGEVWLQGSPLPKLDIKIGRQIVVWGKSDNIRVTDILNPMDQREPGMTDIEDLRLPVAMTRLDYSIGSWVLTGISVHENRFNKLPAYGSDYYISAAPLPKEENPNVSFDNQEVAFCLNGIFSGWEASFYVARVFAHTAHVEGDVGTGYKRIHSRITMFGTAINLVRGNWLYKTEAAFLKGLEFAALPGGEKARMDVLAGVEYSGLTDTTISFEVVNRHIFNFGDGLTASPDSAEEDDFQWAFRISRNFLHERLETVFLAQVHDALGQGGALERVEVTYDIADNWEATAGFVLYQSGDKPSFDDLNACNRLFFRLHFSF